MWLNKITNNLTVGICMAMASALALILLLVKPALLKIFFFIIKKYKIINCLL